MGLEITRAQTMFGAKEMIAAAAAILLGAGTVVAISTQVFGLSSPVAYTTTPFTQAEVDTWTPDRTSPTGSYNSTAFGGRLNVLEMRLTGTLASPTGFLKTEGLQKDIPDSDSIKADVFVDSAWGTQTVRAGLWGVGNDASGGISAYPIVEYSTDTTNQPGFPATMSGWRYWDSTHWESLPSVTVSPGWNTLEITHDRSAHEFVYRINGNIVAQVGDEDSTTIANAILNSRNYSVDYAVRWSNFAYGNVVAGATSKESCKNDGWKTLSGSNGQLFKNQGQCVSSVASKSK